MGLSEAQVAAHNQAAEDLWAAYGRRENVRVPVTFATDEAVWLPLAGHSFREFYEDARVQMRVLLEGDAWQREAFVHDRPLGPPADHWTIIPRFWMDEPECLGCAVTVQENDFAWSRPRPEDKADLLAAIADLDPREMVLGSRLWRLYGAMREAADGLRFRDLPVRVAPPIGTHGPFTIACRVRGEERMLLDMVEDPEFADSFIGLITDKTVERIIAWHDLAQTGAQFPSPHGWGMPDDSLQMISGPMYRRLVLSHHERMYARLSSGDRSMHLCGPAQQHYEALFSELGITALDGPGPWLDHGAVLGRHPQITLAAQADHTILRHGPPGAIERMIRAMLTPTACQAGRFSVMGFLLAGTPLGHVRAMYEAGRRHGLTNRGTVGLAAEI